MGNLWRIVSKPDNVPILGMLLAAVFFAVLALYMALKNDRRKQAGEPTVEESFARKGKVHV